MDHFSETRRVGFGSRVQSSLGGLLLGPILLIIGVGVLFWNEGRENLANIAKEAVNIESGTPGSLVFIEGIVSTPEKIGDGKDFSAGNYLGLKRTVEMYSWKENKKEIRKQNTGGSEEVRTTYDYEKVWTEIPKNSSKFKYPEGHKNPQKKIPSHVFHPSSMSVEGYELSPKKITLPRFSPKGNPLFKGKGSLSNPQIGDLKISYGTVPSPFEGTVFGELSNGKISQYQTEKSSLYRIFEGSPQNAIKTLQKEYSQSLWIIRGLGAFLLFLGFSFLLSVFSVVASFLPIAGRIVGFVSLIFSAVLAALTAFLTILVSNIIHNPLIGGIIVLGIIGIIFFISKNRKKKITDPTVKSTQERPSQIAQQQPIQPQNPVQSQSIPPTPPQSNTPITEGGIDFKTDVDKNN